MVSLQLFAFVRIRSYAAGGKLSMWFLFPLAVGKMPNFHKEKGVCTVHLFYFKLIYPNATRDEEATEIT